MESNFEAAKKFVQYGLSERLAGRRESASGPGSSIKATQEIRHLIITSIKEFNIKSILDLGCGDWNWMKIVMETPAASNVNYIGWDVDEVMINDNIKRYGSPNRTFEVKDIFQAPLPAVDLVICRDVLFHVDLSLATDLIQRITSSSSSYLISTSFPKEPRNTNISSYLNIDGWGFYRINLDLPPFDIKSKIIHTIEETHCSHKEQKRYINLYKL